MAKGYWTKFWGASRLVKTRRTKNGTIKSIFKPVSATSKQFIKSKKSLLAKMKKGSNGRRVSGSKSRGRSSTFNKNLSRDLVRSLVTSALAYRTTGTSGHRRRR